MMNYIRLELKAGRGGDGIISWTKTKYNSRLGPAGGNGGDGGNVYLVLDSKYSDFSHLRTSEKKAQNGSNGQRDNKSGSAGADIYLKIPEGTEIYDLNKKVKRLNLEKKDKNLLICRGGRGGRGNYSFKNAQFQAPWLYELGEEGEISNVLLIKEEVNYVGIISLSGESLSTNLIARLQEISSKKDHINFFSFPFTIFEKDRIKNFYLRDLEICKTIVIVAEFPDDKWTQKQIKLEKILKEIGFNSSSTIFFSENANSTNCQNSSVILCSWKNSEIKKIYQKIVKDLANINGLPCFKPKGLIEDDDYIEYSDDLLTEKGDYQIIKIPEGWEVNSKRLNYWSSRIPQTTLHNIERLKTKLRVEEIMKKIKKSGGLKGETLRIYNYITNIY
ncbi:GTPase ObgE [Mycoplasma ovis str. Michigan]|uniref:GTPase ObgE n=1 Tax=Mycoplasma ovis str. Michigan TaxID=1415773 RepID=A0ABN4BKR4_9MOLU|nr:GTPase ObgE [Mycoplasma ovis str. Michigan]